MDTPITQPRETPPPAAPLVSPPEPLPPFLWGLLALLEVPPGKHAICYPPEETPQAYPPGTYWLKGVPGGSLQVRWVHTDRRKVPLPLLQAVSADGWELSLQVALIVEVADPLRVAACESPLEALRDMARSVVLAQIAAMDQQGLVRALGGAESAAGESAPAAVALRTIEEQICRQVDERAAALGLHIVDAAILHFQGDERLLSTLQGQALERLQAIQAHRTALLERRLHEREIALEARLAEAERLVALAQAQTALQIAQLEGEGQVQAAHTEAEVQEIRQMQEAREAERKRIAEEWRTAKELELRSMEYQHAETLSIIEGTARIAGEAAKRGAITTLTPSGRPLHVDEGLPDAVATGLHVLRGFREKLTPPAAHFLPMPMAARLPQNGENRLEAEALRLERLRGLEHEIILRNGMLHEARLWRVSEDGAEPPELTFTCPPEYPRQPPAVRLTRQGETREWTPQDWDPRLYLADLAREVLFDILREEEGEVSPDAP